MFSDGDKRVLRELAKRVAEVAGLAVQAERVGLWKKHNSLRGERPMLLVFPEGAWRELMPRERFRCKDEAARDLERVLGERLYCHEHFPDDNVCHANVDLYKSIRNSGWGVSAKRIASSEKLGAWKFDPIIFEPGDLKKLRFPKIEYDAEDTRKRAEAVEDAVGDLLHVRVHGVTHISYHLMADWTGMRGLEQVMMDMIEAPEFVHEAMAFLTDGHRGVLKQYMEQGLLDLNNDHTYHSSGGNGWTDELPAAGFDGVHVRPQDMWCSAESQELAQVSPAMHAEFALRYEKQLLAPFGLNGYGCCEPLTDKLEDVLTIPGIRRISMSPWADVRKCAEKLGRRAIFSWKPNPATVCGRFDEEAVRRLVRETLEATRGCVVEIILKDTHTCDNEPGRMDRWMGIAREEIERVG